MPDNQLNMKGAHRALADDATLATVLHVIALQLLGEEIYTLDPIELYLRLEESTGARVTDDNESKLQAILTATSTDLFFENPEAFRGIVNTLSEGDPGFMFLEQPTLAEVLWAIYEVELNHEGGKLKQPVQSYVIEALGSEVNEQSVDGSTSAYEHAFSFVEENRERMIEQMEAIGLTDFELPPVRPKQIAESVSGPLESAAQ